MPFAVFRRHQRIMMAILAILAMFAFVVMGELPNLGSMFRTDPAARVVVATLYGQPVYRRDVEEMKAQRFRANAFLMRLSNGANPNVFGDTSTRAIIDALILQHEADELGMPADPKLGAAWLELLTNDGLDSGKFEQIRQEQFQNKLSGDALLTDIANQVRLGKVLQLPEPSLISPLDIYQDYRDQYERVAVDFVQFRVGDFVAGVPDPTPQALKDYYNRYKNLLPDPARETPGFTTPRQVRVEFLSVDGNALANDLKAHLTEAELRAAYEERKKEFILPPLSKLPPDLFAHDPKATLTPPRGPAKAPESEREEPRYKTFAEVRDILAADLADAKAQAEISHKFEQVKTEVMYPYADVYFDYANPDKDDEARAKSRSAAAAPAKPDLRPNAQGLILAYPQKTPIPGTEGLKYELTPPISREEAEDYGSISRSKVGQMVNPFSRASSFADELFDPKTSLFKEFELADMEGRRYLAWKVADVAPRTPPLEEIRDQVVAAWKLDQARPKAKQAAEKLAEEARKHGGDLKQAAGDRPVITTTNISKMQVNPSLDPFRQTGGTPVPSEIPQIPDAGDALRQLIFDLQPKAVAVAPNQPKTTYYVLTPNLRIPADFALLYSPFGPLRGLEQEAFQTAQRRRVVAWMQQLRTKAGLAPDWVPPQEAERASAPHDEE